MDSSSWTDAKFITEDKTIIPVLTPLDIRCPALFALFEGAPTLSTVDFEDLAPDSSRLFLSYDYTGQLPKGVDADTAGCLLASAGQYNLPNLLNACQDILIADLTEKYGARALMPASLEFAKKHHSQIARSTGYKAIITTNKKLLVLYLRAMAEEALEVV